MELHTSGEKGMPVIGDPAVKQVLHSPYIHLVRGLHHLNIILIHFAHPVNTIQTTLQFQDQVRLSTFATKHLIRVPLAPQFFPFLFFFL